MGTAPSAAILAESGRNRNIKRGFLSERGKYSPCKDFLLDAPAKMRLMSEERTRELPNNRSFEEQVFARFDRMEAHFDSRLDGIDDRVKGLEAKALDTKPIWERALAEIFEVKREIVEVKAGIVEVKAGVEDLNRKFDILTLDVMQVRGDQRGVNKRMDELELRIQ